MLTKADIEAEALRIVRSTYVLPRVRKALKAGYAIEMLSPTVAAQASARMAGRTIRPIPRFVSEK